MAKAKPTHAAEAPETPAPDATQDYVVGDSPILLDGALLKPGKTIALTAAQAEDLSGHVSPAHSTGDSE